MSDLERFNIPEVDKINAKINRLLADYYAAIVVSGKDQVEKLLKEAHECFLLREKTDKPLLMFCKDHVTCVSQSLMPEVIIVDKNSTIRESKTSSYFYNLGLDDQVLMFVIELTGTHVISRWSEDFIEYFK